MSTAPLLSRAEVSGPAPSFLTDTALTEHARSPKHPLHDSSDPRPLAYSEAATPAPLLRPPPQPRQAPTATAFSFYYKPAAIAQPPGATGGHRPPPRMLGVVVREPPRRWPRTRQIGTTAPKSLRGGKAVDGRPQRSRARILSENLFLAKDIQKSCLADNQIKPFQPTIGMELVQESNDTESLSFYNVIYTCALPNASLSIPVNIGLQDRVGNAFPLESVYFMARIIGFVAQVVMLQPYTN
ncbi:unnamed protein product [Coccothraustes coccothraustes]